MVAGLSTLGIKFGYAAESTAGTMPTSFTELNRVNSVGGITITPEQIDASALIDQITRYVAGRSDTGGTVNVTVNIQDEVVTEWETLISAYEALTGGKKMWFCLKHPSMTKGFCFSAQPPKLIPQPEASQNALFTAEIPLVIEEYTGLTAGVSVA